MIDRWLLLRDFMMQMQYESAISIMQLGKIWPLCFNVNMPAWRVDAERKNLLGVPQIPQGTTRQFSVCWICKSASHGVQLEAVLQIP